MKVVVTGGAGFIGSHLCELAFKKGHDITVIDNITRTSFNLEYLKKNCPKINFVKADVRNLDSFKDSFKDADIVFHTAGQVAVTTSITNPALDYSINSTGTFNVCEAARLSNKKPVIVFCSTNKVYGDLEIPVVEKEKRYEYRDIKGVSEKFEVSPETSNCPYGCTKINAENILVSYFHTYGIPTVRARMSCIYGTRQFGIEDQGWISWFAIRTLLKKPLTIYGDGKQVRDILFVKDHANAFFKLAENFKKTQGQAFNLGGGPENTISLIELLELLNELTGIKTEIKFDNQRQGDQKVYISDTSKIKNTVDWKPEVNVREGVKQLVDWTRENIGLFR